jgi:hypothetical protein
VDAGEWVLRLDDLRRSEDDVWTRRADAGEDSDQQGQPDDPLSCDADGETAGDTVDDEAHDTGF